MWLPRPDPAREGASVAKLPSELLGVLEQEGVKFGSAIPEATALRKLSATGFPTRPKNLAQLLRECREQIVTDDDRVILNMLCKRLLCRAGDDTRVPLDRVVQQVGGGRRGALGGWVVPLDRVNEVLRKELEHPISPRVPQHDNRRAGAGLPPGCLEACTIIARRVGDEVRNVLPTAYAYCMEDCAGNASLSQRWQATVPEALVFAERKWVALTEIDNVYFDDINDRRFVPENVNLLIVTSGHLGNSPREQLRTAEALGLRCLSSSVEMEWHGENEMLPVSNDWISRFDLIRQLLQRVRQGPQVESDKTGAETGTGLQLNRVRMLTVKVSIGSAPAERVPVNARLNDGILTLAGSPVRFGADAAKETTTPFFLWTAHKSSGGPHRSASSDRRSFGLQFGCQQVPALLRSELQLTANVPEASRHRGSRRSRTQAHPKPRMSLTHSENTYKRGWSGASVTRFRRPRTW